LRLAGTSMAAPHVSGTAALILSRHPEFTVEQVRQVLRAAADDLGPPGHDARYGYGRLNAARAVAIDTAAVARLQAPKHLSRYHGEPVAIQATIENPGGPTPGWRLLTGPQGQPVSEMQAGVVSTVDTGALGRGNYVLQLDVTAANGATATDTLTFTRLAARPSMRQVSNSGSPVFPIVTDFPTYMLRPNAWSNDGQTLVWAQALSFTFFRVVAYDLRTATERVVAEYRFAQEGIRILSPPDVVISADGGTILFNAPEDLSTSNGNAQGRNFQLFQFDTGTGTLTQLSHIPGGTISDFRGLTISADGARAAFVARLDLDPTVGNADGSAELFYWDRSDNTFHQVTNTPAGSGAVLGATPAVALSAGGSAIAFLSLEDLDPSVGNSAHVTQVFVYDLAGARFRQLTRMSFNTLPRRTVEIPLAINPDATEVAAWIDQIGGAGQIDQHTLVLIDAADGTTTELLNAGAPLSLNDVLGFSPDGQRLVFAANTAPDRLAPLPGSSVGREVFQCDLVTRQTHPLTAMNGGCIDSLAAAADGRVALTEGITVTDIDPEGTNADRSAEIYVLDPSGGGGFLRLSRGSVSSGRNGVDGFSLAAVLFKPDGTPLDVVGNDVAITLVGANGQLFRATVPAGSMRASAHGWHFRNGRAADLTRLDLTRVDGTHYRFAAAGKRAALLAAATPYLTVEVQVGAAIFSNSQTFHTRGHRLMYP
jgi:Tol biopolymer transport system component